MVEHLALIGALGEIDLAVIDVIEYVCNGGKTAHSDLVGSVLVLRILNGHCSETSRSPQN